MATYWINTDKKTHGFSPHNVWIESGYAFTGGDIHYGEYFQPVAIGDTILMYANEIGIVAVGEAMETWDGISHQPKLLYQHDNEYRLHTNWYLDLRPAPFTLAQIKESLGYIPNTAFATINNTHLDDALSIHHSTKRLDPGLHLPDELGAGQQYPEGASQQVVVNVYERNPQARAKCIGHHGAKCKVCDFEFRDKYGRIGLGFIHVHHIRPISACRGEYRVDPYNDLVPVCPNCHAMLHQKNPPYSISEMQSIVSRQNA